MEKTIRNSYTPYPYWSYLVTHADVDQYVYERSVEGYTVTSSLNDNLKLCLPVWVGRVSPELLGIKMEIITKQRLQSEIKQIMDRLW